MPAYGGVTLVNSWSAGQIYDFSAWPQRPALNRNGTVAEFTLGLSVFRLFGVDAQADLTAQMRLSTVPGADLSIAMLLAENPVCTMSNLSVRRDRFLATGGFDETLVHNEDLDWLIRLVGAGARVAGDRATHVLYRANPHGLSADLDRMRLGREKVLATAARFGVRPDARAEAVYARYLARRALRLDAGATVALGHTLRGLSQSPAAFLFPLRRGAATAIAACAAPLLPSALRRVLFSAI
jgi:hypothetical protein